jgi:chorismate mutase / prephenate dehydratase
MSEEDALRAVRAQIDAIDREVLRLINERGRCAIEVGRIKRAAGSDANFYRPEREAEVLRRIRDNNPGPLTSADAVRIIREVMSACLALEEPLTVAYLGPAGTYTHAAAQKHFGNSPTFLPLPNIEDILRQVEDGAAAFGVTPIENSLEGPVNQSHDLLFASRLQICGEVILPIRHQLLSHATDPRALKKIYAHGQALAQCRRWLALNCPQAEWVSLSSNAEAARRAVAEVDVAAIAGIAAASLYELPILASNIEDQADNTTRFLVVGREPVPASGDDLTSLAFCTENRVGALCDALQAFSSAGISMTRIQSRPLRQGTWEYIFFTDITGHRDEPVVAAALARLAQATSMCRVLGSYPRAII